MYVTHSILDLIFDLDSPDYNGVEGVINMVKHQVKRLRLDHVLKGQEVDLALLIEEGFHRIDQQGVKNCVENSLKLLNLD